MSTRIKCRFCDWSIPKWRTTKKGKHVEVYGSLMRHIESEHSDKLKELRLKLLAKE